MPPCAAASAFTVRMVVFFKKILCGQFYGAFFVWFTPHRTRVIIFYGRLG